MAISETSDTPPRSTRRVAVLVVHGIGEQRRFDHLQSIASNFHTALLRDSGRMAHVEVRRDDDEDATTPVVMRWRGAEQAMELHFREVYWADLDQAPTLGNWLKLVGWAIAMPGVRRFSDSWYESGAWPEMRPPRQVSMLESAWVRLQLFIISLLFLIMLISVDVGYWLLRRLSFSPSWLSRVRFLIYDHLGDVKLYQDWFTRRDESMEVHGERSRVAIRRRMIKALAQVAREVREGRLDGYYVFGHSLGTVVAFNGLMEHGHVFANYLSYSEWTALPSDFKRRIDISGSAPAREVPARPPWLHPSDAIDRRALFAGLCGFLTLGSPLNKFATLWPALVPVNHDPVFKDVPWINVADCQDIVAGKIGLFALPENPDTVGGLRIQNIEWPDQWTLATAHTRYWKAGKQSRMVDNLISWFEGGPFKPPPARLSRPVAYGIYTVALVILAFTPLLMLAYMTWLMNNSSEIISQFMQDSLASTDGAGWLAHMTELLTSVSFRSLYGRSIDIIVIGSGLVLCFALVRHVWERWRFRPRRVSANPSGALKKSTPDFLSTPQLEANSKKTAVGPSTAAQTAEKLPLPSGGVGGEGILRSQARDS